MELFYNIKCEWLENYKTFFLNDNIGWWFLCEFIISFFLLRNSLKLGWKWNKNENDSKSKKYLFNLFFILINFGFILHCLIQILVHFKLTFVALCGFLFLIILIVYSPRGIYNFFVREQLPKPWWARLRKNNQ